MARAFDDATTGYYLWRTATKWRAAADRAVAPLGLTHAQYSLLASLYGLWRMGAQPSQRELADFSGLEPIYVSKLVRVLEGAGLLARAEHPADPRAMQLTLTEHGTDVARRAMSVIHALQEELTAPIGGTELARTLRALLDVSPSPGEVDENRSETMAPTPTLTGQDIAEAQGAVQALLDRILDGTGSSANEYIALRVLALRGPWTSPAGPHEFLAAQRHLGLDAPTVAGLLAGLEARGLARGTSPGGPGPAELTPEGLALHTRLGEAILPTTRELYSELDPDDLATTHRVLAQVTERAGRLREDL
jgi:DNA-binding MarR family transcriptional regulator